MHTRNESLLRSHAEKLADMFTVMQRSFVLHLSKELTRGNVSFPQYLLLGFLSQQDYPLSMTEVAIRMRHTTAAATGLVDRLERLGYAERQVDERDRRKVMVHITSKGLKLVSLVREDMIGNLIRLMGHLDSEEQRTWVRIYEKIFPYHCS